MKNLRKSKFLHFLNWVLSFIIIYVNKIKMTGWSSFILIMYENKSLVYHSETLGDVTLKHLWFNTLEINCDF